MVNKRKPKSRNRKKGGSSDAPKSQEEDWNAECGSQHRGSNQDLRRPSPTTTPTTPHSYDSSKFGQGADGDMRYQEDSNVSGNWSNGPSRGVRLGSEPRSLPPQNSSWDYQRTRDTRSVEPTGWSSEKVQAKPPSGRRGSGKDMPYSNSGKPSGRSFNNPEIPPRFKRKMENGKDRPPNVDRVAPVDRPLQAPVPLDRPPQSQERAPLMERHVPAERTAPVAADEVWDGTTKMFSRGGYNNEMYSMQQHYYQQQQQYQSLTSVSLPPTPFYGNMSDFHNEACIPSMTPQEQFNTLPPARTRGRGRMRPEDYEMLANAMPAPGRASPARPETPSQGPHSITSSAENLAPQGIRGHEHWQAGPPSPGPPPQSATSHSVSPLKR